MSIRRTRRIVQAASILLLVLIPVLNRSEIDLLNGNYFSLAIGPVWITDPLIGLQTILATGRLDGALILSMIIPLAGAAALGRVFCGWVCPQNLLFEGTDVLARKLGMRRSARALPRHTRTAVTLAVVLAAPLFGFPLASLLSAPGIISLQTARLIKEGVVGAEAILIVLILIAELLVMRRVWCRSLCPVGGFLALFQLPMTMRPKNIEDAQHVCGRCGACNEICQLGLAPMAGAVQPICHNCGDCVDACEDRQGTKRPLRFGL